MRIPRTILLTAALAVVPVAATTPAFATALAGGPTPTIRTADNPPPLPGLPGMNGRRDHCMGHKGFGPIQHLPGQKPPGGDNTQQGQKDRTEKAKDCGATGFPGFGRHQWGRPMTPEQRSCMEKKGFGPRHHEMGNRDQRPTRKDMDQRRQDFEKAAKDCGVAAPRGFHHDPMGSPGPLGHEPKGHDPAGQGRSGGQGGGSGGGGGGRP